MRILKEIKIKNYRAIKDISFKANSINLVVGPNNAGKSSILEAIALLLTSNSKFKDLLIEYNLVAEAATDLIEYLNHFRGYYLDYLIRIGANRADIDGIVRKNPWKLTIEYYEEGMPSSEDTINLKNKVDNAVDNTVRNNKFIFFYTLHLLEKAEKMDVEKLKSDILKELIEQPKLFLTLRKDNDVIRKFVYFPSMEVKDPLLDEALTIFWNHSLEIYSSRRKNRINVVADFYKSSDTSHIKMIYDFAVKKGLIKEIVEFIKERVPYVENIERTADDIYVTLSHNKKSLPLSSMGDGFISLLRLGFLVALSRRGVIIWEEPENSLHPKFIDILAEAIIHYSKDVQFFIATHSLDLVNYILEKAENNERLKDVNIIRLHYRKDTKNIEVETLNGKEAKEEIDEIGADLRIT